MLLYQKGGTVPAANQPPTCNAGADKTITLPTNSVSITATGSDPEAGALTYSWVQLYGPAKATISAPSSGATATLSALVQGYYNFRVTVSDNKGAKATDDVKVTVNAAPVSGTKYINVNLYGSSTSGKYNNTAWNNWQVSTALTSAAFKYSDASTSTVNAVLSATSTVSANSTYYGGGMAPSEVLRFTSPASAARTLTLNGLSTTQTYKLELYASRNVTTSNNNTVFTVNGTAVTINVNNNITNRATFSNLKPNTSGQIVVSIGQTGTANYLNGFILTESSGTTASATRAVVTDRSEILDATGVQVFPNPASSTVQLQLQNGFKGAVQVQLISANGQVQRQWRFEKAESTLLQTLPIGGLAKGEYFVTVQMGNERKTTRITKLN